MPASRPGPDEFTLPAARRLFWVGAVVMVLAGCGEKQTPSAPEGPHYITTIPPFAAIVAPVVRERGRVTALLAAGDSPHTYEPRPADVQRTEAGTAILYGAEHLDAWAADLPAPRHVALLDLVPDRYRLPGVADVHPSSAGARVADPHFWTDPRAVRALLPALVDTLCALDAPGCTIYAANADAFAAELTVLDARLRALLHPVRTVPVLLAHPSFRYFMHRYGPRLVGIVEPYPVKEPAPRALQALVERGRREHAQAIFTQEDLPHRAAEAVAEGTGAPVVPLDPLGGAAGRETYRELLHDNAQKIRNALDPSLAP